MKVLLSSKQLAQKLYMPMLNDFHISKVEVLTGAVNLIHNKGQICLIVENIEGKGIALVSSVRFDWVYNVVAKINEIPIILCFSDGKCEIIMQF